MEDGVIRIAVGLRLGLHLCQSHECTLCGVAVDELGTHGLSCRFSKGRHARHSAVNDIIKRAMDSAKIPSHLEPVGLYRCDGKRPDGTTMVPWKEGEYWCGTQHVRTLWHLLTSPWQLGRVSLSLLMQNTGNA